MTPLQSQIMRRIEFSSHEATAHNAVVVSFDLAGFSDFCNQPTASIEAPYLMKRVFDLLNEYLVEPKKSLFTLESNREQRLLVPSVIKFTGDGALMLWETSRQEAIPQEFCNLVVQTMRSFQQELTEKLPHWQKERRVNKLPKRVRVGIATGVAYALRPPHAFTVLTEPDDFVGYCINLAVRLQDHCPDLGFLVHGNLHPEIQGLVFYDAVKIKGGQTEPVALFSEDVAKVSPAEFKMKFKPRSE